MFTARFCYMEIPARDPQESSQFYKKVFGWKTRERGDGQLAFDDGGSVSGAWVTGRPAMESPGLVAYVMVEDAEHTVTKITDNGGKIVVALGSMEPPGTAQFADPFGNVLGIYQEE